MARYCLAPGEGRPAEKTALCVLTNPDGGEPSESWTYGALDEAARRMGAGLLALGLEPGDRVMIRLDNTSDYALLFFGAIAVGLVPLPASSALSAREVAFLLSDSGARAIAVSASLPVSEIPSGVIVLEEADVARLRTDHDPSPYAETGADDPAFLVYTSGTTANPKGVLQAQRSVWGRRPMYQGWYGIGQHDRMLHAGAFNWTYTLGTGLSDPWANGATALVYTGEKNPAVWPNLIAAHDATLFAAVPSVYRQMLKYSDMGNSALSTLRHGLTAGEHLPGDVDAEWQDRTGTVLYEALGMSELSTYISSSPSVPIRTGAVGKPQPGRCVRILSVDGGTDPLPAGDIGLIAAHRTDPGLMLRYWNSGANSDDDVFREDWFLGGDLGQMDEDGYITHAGRNDDLMNALGYRVSPLEVERVLGDHPDIAEVATTEVQVRTDVSVIGAFIVPREGAPLEAASVERFAKDNLAAYKVPKEYVFVEVLPRTPNGKVKRSTLRKEYQANSRD